MTDLGTEHTGDENEGTDRYLEVPDDFPDVAPAEASGESETAPTLETPPPEKPPVTRLRLCGACAKVLTDLGAELPPGVSMSSGEQCEGPHGFQSRAATNLVEATGAQLGIARSRGFAIGIPALPAPEVAAESSAPSVAPPRDPLDDARPSPVAGFNALPSGVLVPVKDNKAPKAVGPISSITITLLAGCIAKEGIAAISDSICLDRCIDIARELVRKTNAE